MERGAARWHRCRELVSVLEVVLELLFMVGLVLDPCQCWCWCWSHQRC